jgi:hypothetical protein
LIVKLVFADLDTTSGPAGNTEFVLQVILRRVPSSATCQTLISLFAVTALVFTVQEPPEAAVEHENAPAAAELQEATDGLAAERKISPTKI